MTDYCDNCNKVIPRDGIICAYRGVICCSENCMKEAPRTIAARNALALALWPDDEDDDRPTDAELAYIYGALAACVLAFTASLFVIGCLL